MDKKRFWIIIIVFLSLSATHCTPPSPMVIATQPVLQPTSVISSPISPPLPTATATALPLTPTPSGPALGDMRLRAIDGMVMVFAPGGEFQMGSTDAMVDYGVQSCNLFVNNCKREWFTDQQPAHQVTLDSFWIDRTEVTNGQYTQCVAAGECQPPKSNRSETRKSYYGNVVFDNYPVIHVSRDDAQAYCTWAGGRLPTEAEWEYAARGSQGTIFPWGNGFDGLRLNYCDASCPETIWRDRWTDDGNLETAPVGSYPSGASWIGALDLAGNVWEWVADWYGEYPAEAQVNPQGPSSGEVRVVRGGAWEDEPCDAMSVYRTWFYPGGTAGEWEITPGFRCAMSIP